MMLKNRAKLMTYLGSPLATLGYSTYRKSSFRKKLSEDRYYQVHLIIEDSLNLHCTLLFGLYCADVERAISTSPISSLLKAQVALGMPTVFWPLSTFSEGASLLPSGPLSPESLTQSLNLILQAISSAEARLSDSLKLVSAILDDFRLPIGHHAFRIPLILEESDFKHAQAEYLQYVQSVGFIHDYQAKIGVLLSHYRHVSNG